MEPTNNKNSEQTDFIENDGYSEIFTAQNILNLKVYLHLTIVEFIQSYSLGIRNNKPMEGLISREMAADDAARFAEALGLIHWTRTELTGVEDEDKEILKCNAEADAFEKKLKFFKESIGFDENRRTDLVKVANFKIGLIAKAINSTRAKRVKVLF